MNGGYAGKILRINLTNKKISTTPTARYEEWVGGHGMGSAIFFDIVVREKKLDLKRLDGFDAENVVTLMTSPISGTLVPGGSGRTEVQAIGVQSYPIGWFTRGNFGGRFSAQLKYAGWDGIVIEGAADSPVWIDIRDDRVKIRDCSELSLWGTDTWECQQIIFDYVGGTGAYKDWVQPEGMKGTTTQRPAVLAIGPAGENRCRTACAIHDAGNGLGQGGFGGILGSKNLKAVSVIGTGYVKMANPKALIEARLYQKDHYQFKLGDQKEAFAANQGAAPKPHVLWPELFKGGYRPQACVGCNAGCRGRYEDGIGNESSCVETDIYNDAKSADLSRQASDLVNKYGINAFEMQKIPYLRDLGKQGILGPGKKIDTGDFSMDDYGAPGFYERFLKIMAYRKGDFGDAIAEGFFRAARRWGRLEEDSRTGLLPYPYWGLPEHLYDPRAEVYWGYGTIIGDRDINEHCFNTFLWDVLIASFKGEAPQLTAEESVRIISEKLVPYQGDLLMLDFNTQNIYSEHMVKLVAWHRHYTRFWKQSVLYCDWRWPDFINLNAPDKRGSTGEAEPRFLTAVTGKKLNFLQGIGLGRRIFNLDHTLWTLQGRHRDMVHFADYIYKEPFRQWALGTSYPLPGRENGQWKYINVVGRKLDRDKFEEWKTRFYRHEGWDPNTGYPTQKTLESLGLGYVANELSRKGKLGKS